MIKFGFLNKKVKPQYSLTPLGETKAEEFKVSGPKGEVISALEQVGPATVHEIAQAAKMTPGLAKRILASLISSGWVRKVNAEEN